MSNEASWLGRSPVAVENPQGRAGLLIVCDHASNWVPPALNALGLPAQEIERHIAWDPGALPVAQHLAQLLDAPLVYACVSRLVLDVNRDPAHAGSIVSVSEDTRIPGNTPVAPEDRARRVRDIYEPYHRRLGETLAAQLTRHAKLRLVSIHSFTPVYRGRHRPWHVGVLYDQDRRMAQPLLELLRAEPDLCVGDNEPYAPTDGVYHTLGRHCSERGLRSVLLELRADLVGETIAQRQWAQKLARVLEAISE